MIKKRGRLYWLDLWVGKKRVRRSLRTDERAVAIERARDITLELRKPRPPGVPFAEFRERYLAWARQAHPSSAKDAEWNSAIISTWLNNAGLLTLEVITPYHIEQMRAFLLTRPIGKRTKRTLTRSTVNRYLALLRSMFNRAKDWGEFKGDNPVSRVKFYREGAKVRPLTEAEVSAILAEASRLAALKHATPLQREAPALFRFILNTGLRRTEALTLRWADIGDDTLTIRGKGGKVRTIPINAEAREILAGRQRTMSFIFDIPGRTSDSLLRRLTATISKNAGVHFHVHQLRHVFASRLLAAGVDVVTISQLLGHSAYMTTLLYSHSNAKQMREAVTMIGQRQDSLSR